MYDLTLGFDIIPGIDRRQEFHVVIRAEQPFVAVIHNQQLGRHVAEQMQHVRPINKIAPVVGVFRSHADPDQ